MFSGVKFHVVTSCISIQEHKKVQQYFIEVKIPPELHNGPFLCCYGISLCDPDCDHESFLEKLLYLTNEISKSSIHRPQMIQHIVEMLRTVTVSCTNKIV